MAANQEGPGRPIQVFLNTRQFIQVQKKVAGGGNRDFFAGDDRAFARHKERMRQKVKDAAAALRREGQAAGFVVVQMREEALAKSYRPIGALFSQGHKFGLVGGGRIGEMYFQCTPEALDRLDTIIEQRAELHPRIVENEKTGEPEPRVSAYRSELGAVEDVALPTASDRIDFSAREAVEWLRTPGTLGGYIVELFRPHWSVEPQKVHRMIGQFRDRLSKLGGIVALPVARSKAATSGTGPIAISVHLGAPDQGHRILLPISGETPAREDEIAAEGALRKLVPMGDIPIERHQHLLDILGAEPIIRRVDLPPVIQGTPFGQVRTESANDLPPPQAGRNYPVVGIVDGGVAAIPAIAAWRAGGTNAIDPDDQDHGHGTFIAGLISGGRHFNRHIEASLERDGCRFYDIDLIPREGLLNTYYGTPREFFDQLEEQVVRAKVESGARIFNFSLGAPAMRRGLGYSLFAHALDEIAVAHDVIFVVSAGNLRGLEARPPWPAKGDDALAMLAGRAGASERITAPAEHLLGLSVGAINPPGVTGHEPEVPTTYTRRGPGAGGARKPELCHFGGVSPRGGNRTGLFSLGADGAVVDSNGTSFAAPLVASSLAALDHRLEGMAPRETLLALPVHRAQRCKAMGHKSLRHIAREFVGFGKAPPAEACLADDPHSVTLVFTETLLAKRELEFVFSWPRSLVLGDGKCRGAVDLTLAHTPPIDPEFGAECLRVQLEAYLHQLEIDAVTEEEQPQSRLSLYDNGLPQGLEYTERYLLESGLKWTPIKRYSLSMPKGRGTSSDWRLVLRSFTRAGASFPDEGVRFALIMTIADSAGKAGIYDEMRNEIRPHLRRLVQAIRNNWPNTRILIRADSHYCSPPVIDWCRANDVDFILGLAPTTTLRKHVADLEASTLARFEVSEKTNKVRRFKEFVDGAASWSRVERIIAGVEVGAQGTDTRFIVTNLAGGKAKALYEDLYCRRGAAENHIKSWKTHLAADRTSCTKATANQFRLFLHAGAYWLMWGLRAAMPKRSSFAVAQFDTLRLRLIKIAARVVEMKTQILLHLPTSCPDQRILRIVLDRIPRLVT